MNHWLNWNSQTDNVVVSNDSSLCIGSCAEEQKFSVEKDLAAGKLVSDAIDASTLKIVTFNSIKNFRHVRNNSNVSITYNGKSFEETLTVEFDSADKAEEFCNHVSQYLQKNLEKVLGDYSRYYSLILMICSVLFSAVFLFSFFNKFRIIAYAVPLVCVIGTLAFVIRKENQQRKITRWTSEPDTKLFTVPAIRAVAFCVIFSVFSLVTTPFLASKYGPGALVEAAENNSLSSSEVNDYLQRGSSVNFSDGDGRTALWWSLKHQDNDLSAALINAGADVSVGYGSLLEHALNHSASEQIIYVMMNKGVLEVAETMSGFDTRQHIDSNTGNFVKAFYRYRNSNQFNR